MIHDKGTRNHLFLIPGMMAPASSLLPLAKFLQNSVKEYSITVIPLGLSIASFPTLVQKTTNMIFSKIDENLPEENTVTLFGHSHGGRVASEAACILKEKGFSVSLITAGTPMVKRPEQLPLYLKSFFRISKAYRDWPSIQQPDLSVGRQIGYYSIADTIVLPQYAIEGYKGELRMLERYSHHELIVPAKTGHIYVDAFEGLVQ